MQIDVLGRLLLALVLGAAVGLERERSRKPAGLRTIMLICVGAELLTEASLRAATFQVHDLVRADPARIAAQIVSGIGFIGAGTILVYRGVVVTLVVLGWIEGRFFPDRTLNTLVVTLEGPDVAPELVEDSLAELGFHSTRLLLERDGEALTVGYRVSGTRAARDQLLERLFGEPRVRSAKVD
jgi:hypothetical protein